jgi:hypothetical protein
MQAEGVLMTYSEEELEDKVGKHVNADLLALWFSIAAARSVSETCCENLLDNFS